jgi:uncharacterized protein YpmS
MILAAVDVNSLQFGLMQYGILGILAFLLGYFAWQQYLRLVKKNEELEIKVDRLQEDMLKILVEERDRLDTLIRENTAALQELQKMIYKYMVKNKD